MRSLLLHEVLGMELMSIPGTVRTLIARSTRYACSDDFDYQEMELWYSQPQAERYLKNGGITCSLYFGSVMDTGGLGMRR